MSSMINTNIASLNAQRNLNTSQVNLATSLQRLSSGLRINSAKDDAAGMAISERMTSQIRGLNQAARNANDAISLSQTAEGALDNITNNLQRIRELAVQSANATNSTSDRATINSEAQSLVSEIDRVAQTTSFNGKALLDGSFTAQNFQVGANANQTIAVTMANTRTTSLGAYASVQSSVTAATRSLGATIAATGVAAASVMGATDLVVNGVAVGASAADGISYVGTTLTGSSSQSAIAIASAINAASTSGAAATADANVIDLGTVTTATLAANDLKINGVAISAATYAGATATDITTAINNQQNQTGVVASFDASNHLILTAADGRNITLTKAATTGAATMFASATTAGVTSVGASGTPSTVIASSTTASEVTVRSTVTLTESATILLAAGAGTIAHTGFSAGSTAVSSTTAIGSISLSTDTLSQTALTSIDSALSAVNNARANLGAYQNRFMSTVANLQATSENLSASRSRIQDADFAAETSNLTRGQIMQQAGTAMLAQANAIPNGVMALLR